MAVIKYKNPKYTESGSEPKYIVIPTLTMENDEVYVGTTEPTGGEKIWVNPSNGLTKYKNGESWEDLVPEVDLSNYLAKDNSTEYIPSGEYNPSTKGYVDKQWFNVNSVISKLREYSTDTDITQFIIDTYGSIANLKNGIESKHLHRNSIIYVNANLDDAPTYHLFSMYADSNTPHKNTIIEHFDITINDDSVSGYRKYYMFLEASGNGTKALMNNGQYVSTVLESNKNILRRVNIGTLTLTVGTNDSVNITNSNTLNSINPFEWFIITCNLNGSDTYLYSYNDSDGIKCFRHYTNQDSNRSVTFIITNINTENGTIDIDFRNVKYATKKETSDTESGLMSPSYKKTLDTITGINTVTTLANLPITKRSIVATVTAATSLSLASNLGLGQELYMRIYNNSSSAITQPIPNSGNFVSMNGTSVSIPSKSFIEMSIWCYESGKYSIRIGEIA